jgi:hypothetical protein
MQDLNYDVDQKQAERDAQEADPKSSRRVSFGSIKEQGVYIMYLCPPVEPDLKSPLLPLETHSSLNPSGEGGFCACNRRTPMNKWLTEPHFKYIQPLLHYKDQQGNIRPISVTDGCVVCEQLASGELTDNQNERIAKRVWLAMMIKIAFRPIGGQFARYDWKPEPYLLRPTQAQGILDCIGKAGNICNYNSAVFLEMKRTGTGRYDTKYKVDLETSSWRTPVKLTEEQRQIINDTIGRGGVAYPYSILRKIVKDRDGMTKILRGEQISFDGGRSNREPAGAFDAGAFMSGGPTMTSNTPTPPVAFDAVPPAPVAKSTTESSRIAALRERAFQANLPCFGSDCDPADKDCQECEFFQDCAPACGLSLDPKPAPAVGLDWEKRLRRDVVYDCETGNGSFRGRYAGGARKKLFFELTDGTRKSIPAQEVLRAVEVGNGTTGDDDLQAALDRKVEEISRQL